MPVPTLTDGVVTLRAHRDSDLEDCLEQNNDPLSQAWTRVPVPYTRDDARRFLREAMPGGWVVGIEWGFAIEAIDPSGTPRYAGTVSLRPSPSDGASTERPLQAEIAYGAHPWARGRGLVTRALRLLVDWGFAEQGLQTVTWHAQAGNWASRKTAWRLGFSCHGPVRQAMQFRDGLVDAWIGTLHRDDVREPLCAWLEAPVIEGRGVRLRPHHESDVERVRQASADPDTAYWLGGLPSPYRTQDAIAFLDERAERMARGNALLWVVADPASDDLLGLVSLGDLGGPYGAEVGYCTHPDARGRGLITEAVGIAVRHAFIDLADGGLGLGTVRLVAAVDNAASRAVAEAAGFREVGVERSATICRDGVHDAVIYDLLATDR